MSQCRASKLKQTGYGLLIILLFWGVKLSAQTEPRLVLPIGHTDYVKAAIFSPDGKLIVTASNDKTARIWDVASGQLLQTLGHHRGIYAANFSPNSKTIITASSDDTVRIWNISSGQLLYVVKGHDATFSPDGKRIITACYDSTARIWNALSGQLLHTLKGHSNWVKTATFSPDGKLIVTASNDSTAHIWDASSGQLLHTLKGHTGDVNTATFSPDGSTLVTASSDDTARIWDVSSGQLLHSLSEYTIVLNSVTFSPDSKKIVTASGDLYTRTWEVSSGQLLHTLEGHTSWVNTACFSSDGNKIVTASGDSTIRIWDARSGQLLSTLKGHTDDVKTAIFSPDGKLIVTASNDRTARIWDASSGQLLHTLEGHTKWVSTASSSPDGNWIVTASVDSKARIWDVSSGQLLHTLEGHTSWVNTACFSSDGNKIVTASYDSTARIWDASSGQLLHTLKRHSNWVNTATFSPDGKLIVTASDDSTARIWDALSGQLLHIVNGHAATFSPDGKRIITASDDSTARIWDALTGQLLHTLNGHTDDVKTATFSSNGKLIITAGRDSTARIWDAGSGQLLYTLLGHPYSVFIASISPDGQKIVTASRFDNRALIWDAESRQLLHTLHVPTFMIRGASFSPDGKRIITVGFGDKTPLIWDVASGQLLHSLSAHTRGVESFKILPNGKNIITTGADHKTILWDATTGKPLYTRLQLTGNDWLVYDEDYRFDGTEGAINYLYFACGLEVVELAQLKDSLWVPGLAEKIMRDEEILTNDKPAPKLKNLNICEFTPVIESPKEEGNKLRYRIVPRRGGLGNTEVIINGNPTYNYAPHQLERKIEEGKEVFYLNLNTDTLQDYLTASTGAANPLQVKAGVKGSGIYGRGATVKLTKNAALEVRPKFYGVFVGVNDYGNPKGANKPNRYRDLNFAQKDAGDMADAVEACARNLFDKDSCFIYRLNGEDNMAPTKDNLQRVLGEIGKKARASDVLYIFFAGHGDLKETDGSKQIRFLLQNAEKRNLKSGSFGTEDLTDWCHPRKIKAQKRVFVFDACHSGQFMNETYAAVQGRDDEGKRIRQLDKLKDQNGMMILAASAENESAYEDETLNQGVLTYHLLQAMKTQAKDTTLTVRTWFDETIDMVKDYCRQNGQQQEPRSFGDGYFYIGNVNDSVRNRIDIACPKIRVGSAVLRATNPTSKQFYPYMQDKLNAALVSAESSRGSMVYSKQTDKAYRIIGDYKLVKGKLEINYDVYFGDAPQKSFIALKARKYKSEDEAVQALLQSVANEIELLSAEWRKKNCKISR